MANPSGRTAVDLANNWSSYKNDMFYNLWAILRKENKTLEECVRFHVHSELNFSNNDINKIQYVDDMHHVTVNFAGIIGAQGTLPLYLREKLLQAPKEKYFDYLLLYDWLQQRSLQLFYYAWLYRRIPTQISNKNSPICQYLNSLTGVSNTHPWREKENFDYRFYFAAHFSNLHRPQSALQQILTTVLSVPVKILNTQGAWIKISPEQRTYLSKSKSAHLGKNSICGEKIWVFQAGFRLVVGPVLGEELEEFLPKQKQFTLIQDILLRYVNQYYLCHLQILVKNKDIQPCRLAVNTWNYLGECCFLGNGTQIGINKSINFMIKL